MKASRRSGTKRRGKLPTKRKPAKTKKVKAKIKAKTKAKPAARPKAKAKAKTKPMAKVKAATKGKRVAKAAPKRRAAPSSSSSSSASASAKSAEAAVEAVVAGMAGAAKVFTWGVRQTWAEGGEDPLEQVRAYARDDEAPHWHYVGSGLADPDKVDAAPGSTSSGLGYELTFRLARTPDETEAPTWPVFALQELGWGILKANLELGPGHYLRRRTVITGGDPATELIGYYLVTDPQLPAVVSGSGSVSFLQLVGITEDELLRCEAGEPDAVEAELVAASPLAITDISRTTATPDADHHARLGTLQQAFGEQCRAIVPDGVTQFSVSATLRDGNLDCAVNAPVPFELGGRAEAALRRIFLSQAAAGQAVQQLRAEVAAKTDSSWTTVIEFDYA